MKNILFVLMIIPFMYACKKELSASEYLTSHQGELTKLNELFKEGRVLIAEKELDKAEKFRIELFNDDVRVAQLNRDFDKMVAEQFESWTKAKMQFERMYKVSIPKGNLLER